MLQRFAQSIGRVPSLKPLSFGPKFMDLGAFMSPQDLAAAKNRTLVVVQLTGGNDGLNTLVPYSQQAYYDSRPTLAVNKTDVLALNGDVALHPNMQGLLDIYNENHLAAVQGVGYPNPNRSHYESMSIWQSASVDVSQYTGWLGRYLDVAKSVDSTLNAVNVDALLWPAVIGEKERAMAVESLKTFKVYPLTGGASSAAQSEASIKALNSIQCSSCQEYNNLVTTMLESGLDALTASDIVQQAAANYQTSVTYPSNDFANRLKLAAQVITSTLKPVVVYLQIGGFDTHAYQKNVQANLLKTVSDGIAAFYKDMDEKGKLDDTLIMTFSEFGRRVKENSSQGTDHGTAEPVFLMGGRVRGGLYGTYPSLTDLDSGDLKFTVDFRQVYSTILQDWLGADPSQILNSPFQNLNVF
jgi:uncharacterized protein (DUF1501 family)